MLRYKIMVTFNAYLVNEKNIEIQILNFSPPFHVIDCPSIMSLKMVQI
jgi:hypothetical protein